MPNMSLKKVPMPEQEPTVRNKNFQEVAMGYTEDMAVEEATRIAVKTVRRFLSEHPEGPAVTFVCFDEQTAAAYRREVGQEG